MKSGLGSLFAILTSHVPQTLCAVVPQTKLPTLKRWIHSEYNLEGLLNLHPVGEVKHSLVQNMTFTFMTQKNSLKETTNRTTNIMIKKKKF
jgi:hypothetical protein